MARVIVLPPPTSPATFHAMARERHRQAVALRLAGDFEGFWALLADVKALDARAHDARIREERLALQEEERRRMARALDLILEKAGR